MCTLVPLRKDNLGDITSSDNYRAIAGGSLLLKLLDTIILMLEGEKLGCDKLQFGYPADTSSSMCSWTVKSKAFEKLDLDIFQNHNTNETTITINDITNQPLIKL